MNEAEAKTKWCPVAGEQRMERQHENCMASACMAWRWNEWNWTTAGGVTRKQEPIAGYCGLAGEIPQ